MFLHFLGVLFTSLIAAASVQQVPQVMTTKAARVNQSEILNYPARVESKVNAKLFSESDGIVSRITAPLGSKISRNGRILIVKHTDPVYQYAPMVLISPVNGIISQVEVTEGSSVVKGQLLAAVTDPTQIKILIEVAALDLPSLRRGLQGELIISGIQTKKEGLKVEVKGISPLVDPATGTATCELALIQDKNSSLILPPGSVGQVSFKVNERKAFVLPDSAIHYKGEEPFVRLVEDGKAKHVAISLGKKQRGQVEILDGLKEGDEIIERASAFVSDGEKVQVQN